jgi:hypothetical protein
MVRMACCRQIMAATRTSDQLINTVFVAIVVRQARERELDRCSVIAALAIVAYVEHQYCRSARAEARAIVASRSRSAKSRRLRGDVPRSRAGRRAGAEVETAAPRREADVTITRSVRERHCTLCAG